MENTKAAYSSYRWVVLVMFMVLIALTQFLWLNFASIEIIVSKQLGLSEFKVGLLIAVFPALNIVLALPVGSLLDAKGFKFTVSIGAILMAVAVIIRLNYNAYAWLLAGQIGIAIGQPFIMNSVPKLAATWFDKDEGVIANGLGSMAMFIGMIAALIITPILTGPHGSGLGKMLYIYGAITVAGSILFLLFAKDNPSVSVRNAQEEKQYKGWDAYKSVLKIKDMLLLMIIMFIGIGFFNGLLTWLDPLLKPNGFTSVQRGIIGGVVIAGGIVGAVIIPILSDKTKRRKPFLVLGAIMGGIITYPFLIVHSFTLALVLAAGMGFFLVSLLPIIFQMIIEIVGEKLTGTATGLTWLLGAIGGVVTIYLMEAIKHVTGSFHNSVWLLIFFFITAVVLSMLLKETHPDRAKKQ